MEKSWELKAPWTNVGVRTPALFITGDKDIVMGFPGVKAYVSKNFKSFVPNLKEIVTLRGGHFIQQEQPARVNELIIAFLHEQTLASSSKLRNSVSRRLCKYVNFSHQEVGTTSKLQ